MRARRRGSASRAAEHSRPPGPAEIEPDEYTLVQPDIFVVPLIAGRPPRDWTEAGRVLLTIEILSPSSGRHDRVRKRRLYQRMGVEYWIVDPDARVVERWLPQSGHPEVCDKLLEWRPEDGVAPLLIDLATMFSSALGEDPG